MASAFTRVNMLPLTACLGECLDLFQALVKVCMEA